MRTGNALFRRLLFEKEKTWFNPALGLTGGEDGTFIRGQIQKGRKSVWCDEAIVYETVPEERWKAGFYLKKSFRIGALQGRLNRRRREPGRVMVNFVYLLAYSAVFPFALLLGRHVWVKVLTKICYNAGCVLSFLHLVHASEKQ